MRVILVILVAVLSLTSRTARACERDRVYSPFEYFYAADAVVVGEVVSLEADGYHVRHRQTLFGTPAGTVTVLAQQECDSLEVGAVVALGVGIPQSRGYYLYPLAPWPAEPENRQLIIDFAGAKAKGDKAIAKLLVAHAAKGWASYVDFPGIALFLNHAPKVVAAMTRADAKRLRAALKRHPRARSKALDKRAQ